MIPRIRSSVSTREVVVSQWTRGICTLVVAREVVGEAVGVPTFGEVVELRAERLRELVGEADDVVLGRQLRQCRSARAARFCRISRSCSTCSTTPGRRTFTTTSVPSCSVAACACPIDAAASGSGSKLAKTSAGSRSSSSTMTLRTTSARDRGSGVLQLRQLGDVLRRQQVTPRGESLAELDERRVRAPRAPAERARDASATSRACGCDRRGSRARVATASSRSRAAAPVARSSALGSPACRLASYPFSTTGRSPCVLRLDRRPPRGADAVVRWRCGCPLSRARDRRRRDPRDHPCHGARRPGAAARATLPRERLRPDRRYLDRRDHRAGPDGPRRRAPSTSRGTAARASTCPTERRSSLVGGRSHSRARHGYAREPGTPLRDSRRRSVASSVIPR